MRHPVLRPVGAALLVGFAVFAAAFGAFWIVLLRDDPDNPGPFYLGLAVMSYAIALVLVLAGSISVADMKVQDVLCS